MENIKFDPSWHENEQQKILRSMKDLELQSQNVRINWMLACNTGLISIFNLYHGDGNKIYIVTISLLGFFISLITVFGIFYSKKGINNIENIWEELKNKDLEKDRWIPLHGYNANDLEKDRIHLSPWEYIPIIFCFCWIIILLYRISII